MATITLGVDLSKQVFSVCQLDARGRLVQRRDLGREAFQVWLAQRPAGAVVAMEACSSAHHWARRCLAHGLQPRLMAAQFVKPFRKSQAAKNDRNDAEAIATAARAAACSGPRPCCRTWRLANNAGSARWPCACRSGRCWWRSRTNMRANYGRCSHAAKTTTRTPGRGIRWRNEQCPCHPLRLEHPRSTSAKR